VTSARPPRECEASIPWDQVGPTAGTSVKRSSPPLPVTNELIEVGAVIPDTETGPMLSLGILTSRHGARYVPQSCAVVRQVAPSSTLMRGRKS
jgi:hypothetical protein